MLYFIQLEILNIESLNVLIAEYKVIAVDVIKPVIGYLNFIALGFIGTQRPSCDTLQNQTIQVAICIEKKVIQYANVEHCFFRYLHDGRDHD